VTAGKVRYVGVSDTPAWKVAQAHGLAGFRGWAPFIALQIEYSLLERTVEGELIPMARELGLGVTPWSPLKSGALSGKYTRENAGKHQADRGPWVLSALTDKAYAIVDKLIEIAKELETTPARVALSWVVARPGVTSTIIGARTLAQLDDNLAALEVELAPDQVAALDALSAPVLDFPANFLRMAGTFMNGGTTVNGESTPAWPMAPRNDSERY
jgi:aryl-alcohol dehydrogenase-like predicted oxidoreductase